MTSLRFALIAIALGACAKQSAVRAPAAPAQTFEQTFELHRLCDDARFESMCTPAHGERPMQVDTNLEAPRVRSAFPA